MARSTSGTICTDDICKILETAARSGVRSLQLAKIGLKVEFGGEERAQQLCSNPMAYPLNTNLPYEDCEKTSGKIVDGPYDKEEIERKAREYKEEKLATLALEDPLEYEEILANPDRYIALFGNEG